jgi:hypothetical protein
MLLKKDPLLRPDAKQALLSQEILPHLTNFLTKLNQTNNMMFEMIIQLNPSAKTAWIIH